MSFRRKCIKKLYSGYCLFEPEKKSIGGMKKQGGASKRQLVLNIGIVVPQYQNRETPLY
jgi:hypothetical protein